MQYGRVATLVLIVGLPGAGKTTQAKRLAAQRHAIRLTPDEWMIPLFGLCWREPLARSTGVISFAGTDNQAGRGWARQSIDVTIVAGSVQLSRDGKVIRVHPIRHDRARELGAFAGPKGRPRRKNSAIENVV